MSEDSSRAAWLPQACSYLRHADPVLARLIDDRPDFDPRVWLAQLPRMDLFGALLFQVTGQQLSVPATRRTLARIQALFGGHLPAPAELLAVDPGQHTAGGHQPHLGTPQGRATRQTRGHTLSPAHRDSNYPGPSLSPVIGPFPPGRAPLRTFRRGRGHLAAWTAA